MQSILIVLIVLLNGNFADGLNHWQAAAQVVPVAAAA